MSWKDTKYPPGKTWEETQAEDRMRGFEAKYPPRWTDGWLVAGGVAALLLVVGSLVLLGLRFL